MTLVASRISPAFFWAALSGLLLWAAFPPLGWSLVAWIAPVGWLVLIDRSKLPGGRPYRAIWVASFLHWLAVLQGIRLAHWALYFGWLALAAYMAIYPTLFVALTRVAKHRLRWPIIVAAPIVWTGLELARGHLFTGLSIALLGHTQVNWTTLVQTADFGGAYATSFLVMFVATGLFQTFFRPDGEQSTSPFWKYWPNLAALGLIVAAIGYGRFQLQVAKTATANSAPQQSLKIALIQHSIDTIFEYNPERNYETFEKYLALSKQAAAEHPDLDLIVWPESAFTANAPDLFFTTEQDIQPLPGMSISVDELRANVTAGALKFGNKTRLLARSINVEDEADNGPSNAVQQRVHFVVGCDSIRFSSDGVQQFNAALLLDSEGAVENRYYKNHRVMFGEYIPFAEMFPWLYQITPMSGGIVSGPGPELFSVSGTKICPSVCFESTVPHLIRRHVAELRATGQMPDLLLNVTNDGWFWGSSLLDLHRTCAVFRAIENRRPMAVAANTGISLITDGNGVVLKELPRREPGSIVVQIPQDNRLSFYQRCGDLFAGICLTISVLAVIVGLYRPLQT